MTKLQKKTAAGTTTITTAEYARLAAFRLAVRSFLHFSEEAAATVGLTGQHHQALLVLRAWPEGRPVTINDLAQQLFIKHNSAVGLVDRLTGEGLVVRMPCSTDRRKVELRLTERGSRVLARLVERHRGELLRIGPELERFFHDLSLQHPRPPEARPARGARAAGD
jgi:DNA-binding MarR family transcriptional regulator